MTEEIKKEIRNGLSLFGSGYCQSEKTINLSLEETEKELLICDNYEDASKFDG